MTQNTQTTEVAPAGGLMLTEKLRPFDAVDIAQALIGPTFKLSGISAPLGLPSWLPVADIRIAHQNEYSSESSDPLKPSRTTTWSLAIMRIVIGLLLLCAGLAAAYWWGESSPLKRAPQALSWHAKEVTTAGVYIQYARTSEIIAPGMQLPNGEKLVSFDPVKQTYSTTQQEVILKRK